MAHWNLTCILRHDYVYCMCGCNCGAQDSVKYRRKKPKKNKLWRSPPWLDCICGSVLYNSVSEWTDIALINMQLLYSKANNEFQDAVPESMRLLIFSVTFFNIKCHYVHIYKYNSKIKCHCGPLYIYIKWHCIYIYYILLIKPIEYQNNHYYSHMFI